MKGACLSGPMDAGNVCGCRTPTAGAGAMSTPEGTWPSLNDIGAELLFEKVLTSCDAASRGRIVLPKVRSCSCGMCYHRTPPVPVTSSTVARWFACCSLHILATCQHDIMCGYVR
jgi:hypothetical protein